MIVGTFLPEIEIWNLDSENCEPICVLGDLETSENAKKATMMSKKQKKAQQMTNTNQPMGGVPEHTHTDAVMCLSLNPFQSEYLLSGSADKTVRVWDLDDMGCKAVYSNLHTDKVQAVRWNKFSDQIFASGGYDGRLNVCDVRAD